MGENLKNRLIVILGILTAIFFLGTISSCNNARKQETGRKKEMLTRLELEEKMSKFNQEKSDCEARINAAVQEAEAEKAAHLVTKKSLTQEQLVNQSLKEELNKVTKLKEALEEDLKEALSKDPRSRR